MSATITETVVAWDLSVLVPLAGAALAFVLGGAWYALLGAPAAAGADAPLSRPGGLTALVEVGRCLVLAAVVTVLALLTGSGTWWQGLLLGVLLFAGFPLVLWTGAVWHERTPVRTALVHGGDWLVKLLAVGALVGALL
jgi:hypothetical protein